MPVVVGIWNNATPVPTNRLVEQVCRLYGHDSADTDLRQAALDALDATVDDMNMGLFEFNLSAEAGVTLTKGQAYVTLGSQVYRESEAYLVPNNGGVQPPLDYIPWPQYQRWYGDDTIPGTPLRYSTFNFESDGRLYLHPTPDANAASTYTLTEEHYRRIPPVSTTTQLALPREIESALIYGAQKRIAILALGAGHPDVAALAGLESQALARLHSVDHTHPAERKRFILADFAKSTPRNRRNELWIKV